MKSIVHIKINGRLDQKWSSYFDEFKINYNGDSTILSGEIRDDASLYGTINKIRNLNLKLISINRSSQNYYSSKKK